MIAPSPDSPLAAGFVASPNFGERRGVRPAELPSSSITPACRPAEAALALLTDPASEVSAHYFVFEDGRIVQLVPERARAWHAGKGHWKGESDLNSASIGIEIVNPGHDGGAPPFPDRQIAATDRARARHSLALDDSRPSGCSPIPTSRPHRKRDPGEAFPWARLHAGGVGHWVEPAPVSGGPLFRHEEEGPPVRALQAMLALYGYGLELTGVYDRHTRAVVTAFQRHFRPGAGRRRGGRLDRRDAEGADRGAGQDVTGWRL